MKAAPPKRRSDAAVELTPNKLLVLLVLARSPRGQFIGKRALAQAALQESDAHHRASQTIFHFLRAIATMPKGLVFSYPAGSRLVYALSAFGADALFGRVPVWLWHFGPYTGAHRHVFIERQTTDELRWTLLPAN